MRFEGGTFRLSKKKLLFGALALSGAAALIASDMRQTPRFTSSDAVADDAARAAEQERKDDRAYYDGFRTALEMPNVRTHELSAHLDDVASFIPAHPGESLRTHANTALAATRSLDFSGFTPSPETVSRVLAERETARQTFGVQPIFRDTTVAVFHAQTGENGVHTFFRQNILDNITAASAHSVLVSGLTDGTFPNGGATHDSLNEARNTFINVIEATRTPLTAIISGHGAPDGSAVELGVYTEEGQSGSVTITPEVLAGVLATRYENARVRRTAQETPDVVMLDFCMSADFAVNLIVELRNQEAQRRARPHMHRFRLPPIVIVAGSEVGQVEYIGQMLDQVFENDQNLHPLIGNLYREDGLVGNREQNSKFTVFVYDGGRQRLTQLVESESIGFG